MKNLIGLVLLLLAISVSVFCQPPQAFKYQAVVRDGTGNIISNQSVDIRISIHDETAGGTVIYQETFSETTNQFGLVNLEIGLGSQIIGPFSSINWSADSKFIEVEIDDGSGYMSMGTSELFSVPYALYSNRSSDSYWDLYNSNIYYNSGNVGIGTNTPGNKLEIFGNGAEVGLRIRYNNTYPTVFGELTHALSGGFKINSNAGGGSWADIHFMTNGTTKMFLESAGNVGIGTMSPGAGLHLKGSGYPSSFMYLQSETGGDAGFRLYEGDDVKWHIFNNSSEDALKIYNTDNSHIVFCADQSTGHVGIGTSTPDAYLHVNDRIRIGEDLTYGSVYGELLHEGAGNGFIINAHAGGGGWADMHFQTNANTRMFIESGGNVGIGTTSPTSRLDVRGNVTIRDNSTGVVAVELGTGLDYAEGFNVSDKSNIHPGTVLCIDPNNPGNLKISSSSYDSKVAGIVAGANNLGSGISLGGKNHDFDVALAGRVYCNVEASNGSIEIGDLLTTSSVSGFAMKVTDRKKAQGAILGKAMESLARGEKGQILVLVTLQ